MEVCLRRISWDSVDAGLRWIYFDLVFILVFTCLILPIFASIHRQWLLIWCAGHVGTQHDDFLTIYYNKVCPAPVQEGR